MRFIHELVSKTATSLTIMFCKKKKYSKQKKEKKEGFIESEIILHIAV